MEMKIPKIAFRIFCVGIQCKECILYEDGKPGNLCSRMYAPSREELFEVAEDLKARILPDCEGVGHSD